MHNGNQFRRFRWGYTWSGIRCLWQKWQHNTEVHYSFLMALDTGPVSKGGKLWPAAVVAVTICCSMHFGRYYRPQTVRDFILIKHYHSSNRASFMVSCKKLGTFASNQQWQLQKKSFIFLLKDVTQDWLQNRRYHRDTRQQSCVEHNRIVQIELREMSDKDALVRSTTAKCTFEGKLPPLISSP